MHSEKTRLIVTGVARSGTTALAELLNSHELICLGIERFKFQFLLKNHYSEDLFEKERFFDFRKADTNLRPDVRPHWKGVYDEIAVKWEEAHVIGDKVPDLLPVLPALMAENPNVRVIVLLRNLKDVALSWQTRADKPRDSWPTGKGFGEACKSWARQMSDLHELYRDKGLRDRILLLDYDSMYDDPDNLTGAILTFLDLPPSEVFRKTLDTHVSFANQRKPRKVPGKFADLYSGTDRKDARALRKEARLRLIDLLDTPHSADGPEE